LDKYDRLSLALHTQKQRLINEQKLDTSKFETVIVDGKNVDGENNIFHEYLANSSIFICKKNLLKRICKTS